MKRLLLPLLAAIALPTAVNAELNEFYLLGAAGYKSYVVPMKTLELCEDAGQKFINRKSWTKKIETSSLYYLCVKAK